MRRESKSAKIEKIIIIVLVAALLLVTKTTAKAIDTTDSNLMNGNIATATGVTADNYKDFSENLVYDKSSNENTYYYRDYCFERCSTFVIVSREGYDADIFVPGSDFVLTDELLWFISDDRDVASFNYNEASYQRVEDETWIYEKYTKLHKKADTEMNFSNTYSNYETAVNVEGTVGFYIPYFTVAFNDNTVSVYNKIKTIGEKTFPFTFKEVGVLDVKYYGDNVVFQFVSSNNIVGQIDISCDGNLDYRIIAEDMPKYVIERKLFKKTSENHVDRVNLENGYMLYYEGTNLIGSDGKVHFNIDDFDWEVKTSGDCYGPYKGIPDCSIMANYFGDETDVEKMVKLTGINY